MVNKVILIGNVGQDPEIRYLQSGSKVANFSIATSDFWKDKETGERRTLTQWHRVVVFNENIASIIEKYVKKGSKLYVEGALQSRKYTGSDGLERSITEVVISQFKGEVSFIDSRNSSDNSFSNNTESQQNYQQSLSSKKEEQSKDHNIGDDLDDEIPF